MMRICFLYSCKWRYEYGPPKCSVIVFKESKCQFQKSDRHWYLGSFSIKEAETYKYLGTVVSKY